MAHRAGFLVPNATDPGIVGNRQAEPDAEDFSVLGNDNYGVLTGFNFTLISGLFAVATASTVNACVIAGEIYKFPMASGDLSSVTIGAGGPDDRFDLVVFDPLGTGNPIHTISGAENFRAKFPDLPPNMLLIAAVYVPMNASPTTIGAGNVIDKRRWLLNGARGAAIDTETFLENRAAGTDQTFKVLGSGLTSIGALGGPRATLKPYSVTSGPDTGPKFDIIGEPDTEGVNTEILLRSTKVTVTNNLAVKGSVAVTGLVTGSNLLAGPVVGTPGSPPDVGHTGSMYQDTLGGRAWIKANDGHWAEIMKDEYPPGTLIASLLDSNYAALWLGTSWVACQGQTITNGQTLYPNLALAFPSWQRTGGALKMPDLKNSFLGSDASAVLGTEALGGNSTTLTQANLPAHKHFSTGSEDVLTVAAGAHSHSARTVTGRAGLHSHAMDAGGQHPHHIEDVTHIHDGADHGSMDGKGTRTNFIAQMWGGDQLLDLVPGDAGHGTVVSLSYQTMPAYSGINHTATDGVHTHSIKLEGEHDHLLNIAAEAEHRHKLPAEAAVGSNVGFDNRPSFINVNWYIKA